MGGTLMGQGGELGRMETEVGQDSGTPHRHWLKNSVSREMRTRQKGPENRVHVVTPQNTGRGSPAPSSLRKGVWVPTSRHPHCASWKDSIFLSEMWPHQRSMHFTSWKAGRGEARCHQPSPHGLQYACKHWSSNTRSPAQSPKLVCPNTPSAVEGFEFGTTLQGQGKQSVPHLE